jgi:2-C-methyl-D-erythritol 4-phosphate cytidylyltransferase
VSNCDAILLAAGRGDRLALGKAKARVELAGEPLFVHALRVLATHPEVQRILLVTPPDEVERGAMEDLARSIAGSRIATVAGGAERQDSARAALEVLHQMQTSWRRPVLIHDAARPLVSSALIDRCLAALEMGLAPIEQGALPGIAGSEAGPAAVVPGLPVRETLKLVFERRVVMTQSRERLYAIQTPQAFRFGMLRRAHQRARSLEMSGTDDAALLEWLGMPVVVVEGDPENLKVTYPQDLALAELLLQRRANLPNDRGGSRVSNIERSAG